MLHTLAFDNRFTRELPADPEPRNFRRQVAGACYSRVAPTPVAAPRLLAHSAEVAALLDLDEPACRTEEFLQVFAGNRLLDAMDPFAMCYGGHQFGNWAGQLGDGRAINLGEVVDRRGRRWCLQLKGAGPTPYSRGADGLAVLRSSVREFLCSEAMHHLGVPTTRALSLVATGEEVIRDMFYDGNPRAEPGAVVCRVAPSFVRFGNFELPAARGDVELLRRLADYTIATDFPGMATGTPAAWSGWFEEICRRTVDLVVHWLRVGFVHGVMNTDNMSILGLTIDYGPYGWLEGWDPGWTPNTTDAQGRRYAFGRQPQIALWNLTQLANALYPLVGEAAPFERALDAAVARWQTGYRDMMAAKLGLQRAGGSDDDALIDELHGVLGCTEIDMTIFFRALGHLAPAPDCGDDALLAGIADAFYAAEDLSADARARIAAWLRRWLARARADGDDDARRARMQRVNPKYVLRNWLAQEVIDAAEAGDCAPLHALLDVLRRPYDEQPGRERMNARRPEWARHRAGCSMLSCSS